MSQSVKKTLYRVAFQTFLIYTLISLLFTVIAVSGNPNFAPTLPSLLIFLCFGLAFALCNLILHIDKWSMLLRLVIHYLSLMAVGFLSLFVATKNTSQYGALLLLFAFFTVVYLLFAVIYASVKRHEKEANSPKYKRQF